MSILQSSIFRVIASLILFGVLALSIIQVKNCVIKSWGQEMNQIDLYNKAPNCDPRMDASKIDLKIQPCSYASETVVDKPQKTVVHHYRYHDYQSVKRYLTLRDQQGNTQTVKVGDEMWYSTNIGNQAVVQIWQNRINEVTINGNTQTIFDEKAFDESNRPLIIWGSVVLISMSLLSLLWRLSRRPASEACISTQP